MLVMVTVQGGDAKRGNFTAAFSDQLRTSYRQTDVMVMFTRASYSLTDEAGWNTIDQLPERRSTLRKVLRL